MHKPIIIFDVDGPLMNPRWALLALLELKHDPRLKWNQELLKKTTALDLLHLFEAAASTNNIRYAININRGYRKLLPKFLPRFLFLIIAGFRIRKFEHLWGDFFKGVTETLESLHQKNILMGLCSASGTKRIEGWLHKKNLTKIITSYTSRDDRKQYGLKPNPRPLLATVLKIKKAHHLGKIDKGRIVFVGDNTWDIHTAKNAGIKSIAVLSGNGTRKELGLLKPDFMISGVAQIPALLNKLFTPTLQSTM